ncbi:hypothetical protein DPMN_075807 [Dreissena polymorpha]|uniref:Reverse transcriptase RNase H-like domain-containing protein n=1 Tax=Dreissena polymorpha TaxID=45954 RepID=A0A9D3YHY1_DREPO|nr:hypothetical protein DPMN_075807 [Dreissena polymorpha]
MKPNLILASKELDKCQRRYCATRRERLAVVTFVTQFRHNLIGKEFFEKDYVIPITNRSNGKMVGMNQEHGCDSCLRKHKQCSDFSQFDDANGQTTNVGIITDS